MNFLAHLYLSGGVSDVMLGNFIADYVKGKRYENYRPMVQQGILLHRKIDAFTDSHDIVKQSAQKFKPAYGRYASVVIDVIYDHYLAKLWNDYSELPLKNFVNDAHAYLLRHYFSLPAGVKGFLPFLIKSRRLEKYQYFDDLEQSLRIMSNHSSLPAKSLEAIEILEQNYKDIQMEFQCFFDDIRQMVKVELGSEVFKERL